MDNWPPRFQPRARGIWCGVIEFLAANLAHSNLLVIFHFAFNQGQRDLAAVRRAALDCRAAPSQGLALTAAQPTRLWAGLHLAAPALARLPLAEDLVHRRVSVAPPALASTSPPRRSMHQHPPWDLVRTRLRLWPAALVSGQVLARWAARRQHLALALPIPLDLALALVWWWWLR